MRQSSRSISQRSSHIDDCKVAAKQGYYDSAAILLVHDIFGWTFTNARLLADHFAKEADATVYLPDL